MQNMFNFMCNFEATHNFFRLQLGKSCHFMFINLLAQPLFYCILTFSLSRHIDSPHLLELTGSIFVSPLRHCIKEMAGYSQMKGDTT